MHSALYMYEFKIMICLRLVKYASGGMCDPTFDIGLILPKKKKKWISYIVPDHKQANNIEN